MNNTLFWSNGIVMTVYTMVILWMCAYRFSIYAFLQREGFAKKERLKLIFGKGIKHFRHDIVPIAIVLALLVLFVLGMMATLRYYWFPNHSVSMMMIPSFTAGYIAFKRRAKKTYASLGITVSILIIFTTSIFITSNPTSTDARYFFSLSERLPCTGTVRFGLFSHPPPCSRLHPEENTCHEFMQDVLRNQQIHTTLPDCNTTNAYCCNENNLCDAPEGYRPLTLTVTQPSKEAANTCRTFVVIIYLTQALLLLLFVILAVRLHRMK